MSAAAPHIPVMLDEVLSAISPSDGEVYVDGTFGAGGYTKAILERADCSVIAIDRDRSALERADDMKAHYKNRLVPLHGCFGDADMLAASAGYDQVHGFVLDLGVSSMQLDEAERGFSFRHDGPLDMRMDRGSDGPSAADIVNKTKEKDLADIIYHYGEERHSRRVARVVCEARKEAPITTTGALAEIVRRAVPPSRKDNIDPATRTFQALRIFVNRELDELKKALLAAIKLLREGGRLVVVSFHSLEDTIVKRFMLSLSSGQSGASRHLPVSDHALPQLFTLPSRKAVFPSQAEISQNPRSRSARLRCAVRTDMPMTASLDAEQIWGRG